MNYEVDITNRYSGHFELKVYKADTGILVRSLEFDNLILNSGLNRMGLTTSLSNRPILGAAIGTGTSTPVVTQTGLDAAVAFTTTTVVGSTNQTNQTTTLPYYSQSSASFRFAAGTLNGNYSEVGVGWNISSMFSRALILDALGNPTTITVLSDEFLEVTYKLRMYIPTTDTVVPITITGIGSDIPVTIRPYSITTVSNVGSVSPGAWGLGAIYDLNSGNAFYALGDSPTWAWTTLTSLSALTTTGFSIRGNSTGTVTTSATYITDTFYRDSTLRSGLDSHNGSLQHLAVSFRCAGSYQFLLGTTINKTTNNIFDFNVRCSWARRIL